MLLIKVLRSLGYSNFWFDLELHSIINYLFIHFYVPQQKNMNIKHSVLIDGEIKTFKITWTLPEFINILKTNRSREFRTSIPKDSTLNLPIELKMKFLGLHNDAVEMYYLFKEHSILSSKLIITNLYDDYRTIFDQSYTTKKINRWQYMVTFCKLDIFSKGTGFNSSNIYLDSKCNLNLEFHLSVPDIKPDETQSKEVGLGNDFHHLLTSGLFSDVHMKSCEGDEYKVHKAILTCHSAVLRAYFEHNTTECSTNIVESPFDSEVLHEVITFIYSDEAPKMNEIPEKLLAAADYYQLNKLKSLCEKVLHKKLTVENAIEILELADLYSANNLIQLTLDFIKDDQIELIMKTEGWKKCQSVNLIKQLSQYIMNDEQEYRIKYIDIDEE